MDTVSRDARASQEAFQTGGPGTRPAQEDITLSQVRDPGLQGSDLVVAGGRAEDRVRACPRPGQRQHLQAAALGDAVELFGEERLTGEPVQQDRLTGTVREALGQAA